VTVFFIQSLHLLSVTTNANHYCFINKSIPKRHAPKFPDEKQNSLIF